MNQLLGGIIVGKIDTPEITEFKAGLIEERDDALTELQKRSKAFKDM
jgi:hypothetical protein